MPRLLPTLTVQASSRSREGAVLDLRTELLELLEDFPATRLVVYPEYHTCATSGGPAEGTRRQYELLAEPLDGPHVAALCEVASAAGVWLIPGTVVERGAKGELLNTAVAISPAGEVVAAYRKIFPWRPFEPFRPGGEFVTFDIPDVGRVGLCVCYDLWFPEVIRHLGWMGAELVVCPTQTSTRDRSHELVLAQANAIQNQVFVLSANAAEPAGTGRSVLVDPEGLIGLAVTIWLLAHLDSAAIRLGSVWVVIGSSGSSSSPRASAGRRRRWTSPRTRDLRSSPRRSPPDLGRPHRRGCPAPPAHEARPPRSWATEQVVSRS